MLDEINDDLKKFYRQHLDAYGPGAKGVGWKNEQAQLVRFEQLMKVIQQNHSFSINDLGCGVGDLVKYLLDNQFHDFTYTGYDLLEEMVKLAQNAYTIHSNCKFQHINKSAEMVEADYTVASGIFNIRYAATDEEWLAYITQTLEQMHIKSKKGFAFNVLTTYSDKEFMQDYLYYSDPLFLFDYCKKNFAKNVALLHDYYQYDFTIIVRKM